MLSASNLFAYDSCKDIAVVRCACNMFASIYKTFEKTFDTFYKSFRTLIRKTFVSLFIMVNDAIKCYGYESIFDFVKWAICISLSKQICLLSESNSRAGNSCNALPQDYDGTKNVFNKNKHLKDEVDWQNTHSKQYKAPQPREKQIVYCELVQTVNKPNIGRCNPAENWARTDICRQDWFWKILSRWRSGWHLLYWGWEWLTFRVAIHLMHASAFVANWFTTSLARCFYRQRSKGSLFESSNHVVH